MVYLMFKAPTRGQRINPCIVVPPVIGSAHTLEFLRLRELFSLVPSPLNTFLANLAVSIAVWLSSSLCTNLGLLPDMLPILRLLDCESLFGFPEILLDRLINRIFECHHVPTFELSCRWTFDCVLNSLKLIMSCKSLGRPFVQELIFCPQVVFAVRVLACILRLG